MPRDTFLHCLGPYHCLEEEEKRLGVAVRSCFEAEAHSCFGEEAARTWAEEVAPERQLGEAHTCWPEGAEPSRQKAVPSWETEVQVRQEAVSNIGFGRESQESCCQSASDQAALGSESRSASIVA